MLPAIRRLVALLATVALLLAAASPVAAAEPPVGVVLDADVTVTVTEPGGAPVADASVLLLAYVTDFPEETIQELSAVTGPAGVAQFAGVGRPDAGGPAVHLTAAIEKEELLFDGECLEVHTWSGSTMDVVSADGLDIPVAAGAASSIQCPGPDGEELPDGLVADAALAVDVTLDGSPVDAVVSAFLTWNGWTSVAEAIAVEGTASLEGLPRPAAGGAPVEVVLAATAEVPGEVAGCRYTGSAEGGTTIQLTDEGTVQASIAVNPAAFVAPALQQAITVTDRAGGPIAGATVWLLQERPGAESWSCSATTDAQGAVSMPLYEGATVDAPSAIAFEAHGPVTSTELRGECVLSFGPYGQLHVAHSGGALPAATIETDVIELDAVCSTTSAPGSGVGGGGPTLPPTDVVAAGAPAVAALPATLLVLLVLAVVGLGAALLVPARRRR